MLPVLLLVPVLLGVGANLLASKGRSDAARSSFPGSLRTVELHGVPVTGCERPCPEYNIDTEFATRVGQVSQFAALAPGRTRAGGRLFVNGFGGTLVDVDGNLVADLRGADPAVETVFKRILSGVVADFDNDGNNEILYGLNSYNLFASAEDVRYRQRRSFEMLRTETGDERDYAPVSETAFPMEECPVGETTPCARYYDWRVDGDIRDVAAADFDNDGWLDIAYLGTSLGDHSWIGFATELAAAGIPLSNENVARVGIALNGGASRPGVFSWPRATSTVETYLKDLYPFSGDVDYAPKSQRLLAEDLDEDGNVDLIVVGEKVVVGWGDGTGGFPVVETVLDTPGGTDAAVADTDRDGDLDLFVLADANPRYIDLPRMSCTPQPRCAELGRNEGGTSAVYLSDGRRGFVTFREFQPLEQPTGVTAADVDADGWVDFVVTCVPCVGPGVLRAAIVDGTLTGYDLEPLAVENGHTYLRKSAAVDVDGDGDTDVLLSGSRSVFRQVWTNGAATGADTSRLPGAPAGLLLLGMLLGSLILLAARRRRRENGRRSADA